MGIKWLWQSPRGPSDQSQTGRSGVRLALSSPGIEEQMAEIKYIKAEGGGSLGGPVSGSGLGEEHVSLHRYTPREPPRAPGARATSGPLPNVSFPPLQEPGRLPKPERARPPAGFPGCPCCSVLDSHQEVGTRLSPRGQVASCGGRRRGSRGCRLGLGTTPGGPLR